MTFPQFRKYPHDKTFFRINSPNNFDELQILGDHFRLINVEAKILPDRNYINDMLSNSYEYWVLSDKEEFDKQLLFCETQLKKMS